MKTWQYLWQLVRFLPGKYAAMIGLRVVNFAVVTNVLALVTREFFNALSGDALLHLGPYAIAALLVGVAASRIALCFGDIFLYFISEFEMGALIRKNLLEHILEQPGDSALPASVGEAISRFRGDVDTITNFMVQMPFKVATRPVGTLRSLRDDPNLTRWSPRESSSPWR